MSNIILAIDTSVNCCSVAIYKKKCIYSLSETCKKQHTSKILPMIQKILLQTQTTLKELHYIAFTKGPGNFTSIRIAAGIAHSFSLILRIPIISVSTLLIMAEKAWRKYKKTKIIVSINAKKTHVYWAQYKKNIKSIWTGENTESLLEKKTIEKKISNLKKDWFFVGNGWKDIEHKNFLPNAKDIIPFILLEIKNKKNFFSIKNHINYLYNNFYKK